MLHFSIARKTHRLSSPAARVQGPERPATKHRERRVFLESRGKNRPSDVTQLINPSGNTQLSKAPAAFVLITAKGFNFPNTDKETSFFKIYINQVFLTISFWAIAAAASLREGSASPPGPGRSGCQLRAGDAIFRLVLARSGLGAGPQGCAPPALLKITAKYVLFLSLCQRWDYFWSNESHLAEL